MMHAAEIKSDGTRTPVCDGISTLRHVMISNGNYALLADCHKKNVKAMECGESVVIFVEVIDIFKFVEKLVTLSLPFEYLV